MGIYTDSIEHMEAWEGMVKEFHYAGAENASDIIVNIDDGVDFEEEQDRGSYN